MAESGGGRSEPFIDQEVANGSWRLNVKEFHLPTQNNVVDHQNKSSFSFNGLLRKPSESFLNVLKFFFLCVELRELTDP
jgi:hypothetical protein